MGTLDFCVAPSFISYETIGEPFTKNGKEYIHAINPKTGKERDIRCYSPKEYRKLYPQSEKQQKVGELDCASFPLLKHARGFDKGPILVIRNTESSDEPWLRASVARFAVGIGWYIASEDTLPTNLPPHFKYLLLTFDEFKDADDYHMKSPDEIEKILREKVKKKEWFSIKWILYT